MPKLGDMQPSQMHAVHIWANTSLRFHPHGATLGSGLPPAGLGTAASVVS